MAKEKHKINKKDKFERLSVLDFEVVYRRKQKVTICICECACGKIVKVRKDALYTGNQVSCGCLIREKRSKLSYKHGYSKIRKNGFPEYEAWKHIIQRCKNTNDSGYINYGARGIKVCQRWLEVKNFLEDLGEKPSNKHSIDRIDNNGNYSCGKCEECIENNWPMNCKWSTSKEQCNNTRRNRKVLFKNNLYNLKELAEYLNVNYQYLQYYLKKGYNLDILF